MHSIFASKGRSSLWPNCARLHNSKLIYTVYYIYDVMHYILYITVCSMHYILYVISCMWSYPQWIHSTNLHNRFNLQTANALPGWVLGTSHDVGDTRQLFRNDGHTLAPPGSWSPVGCWEIPHQMIWEYMRWYGHWNGSFSMMAKGYKHGNPQIIRSSVSVCGLKHLESVFCFPQTLKLWSLPQAGSILGCQTFQVWPSSDRAVCVPLSC